MKNKIVTRVIPSLMLASFMLASNVTADIPNNVLAAHGHSSHNDKYSNKGKDSDRNKKNSDDSNNLKLIPESLENKTVIIYTNDSHGNIEGFKYVPAIEQKLKTLNADAVVTVDCGDFSETKTGTEYVEESEGRSAIQIMNAAGYDVVALGNHEFDFANYGSKDNKYSPDRTDEIQEKFSPEHAKFKTISANIVYEDDPSKTLMAPNTLYTAKDDNGNNLVNIGFFGLDTCETEESGHKSSGLTNGLNFLDEHEKLYECAANQVSSLKTQGADLVICLAHLGIEQSDKREAAGDRSYEVYNGVKDGGIDLMLDANSHDVMTSWNGSSKSTARDKNDRPEGLPIMSTGKEFANIGLVIIDNDTKQIDNWLLLNESEYKEFTSDVTDNDAITATKQLIKDTKDHKFTDTGVDKDYSKEKNEVDTSGQVEETPEVIEETNNSQPESEQNVDESQKDDVTEDTQDDNDHTSDDDHHHRNNHGHHHH